MKTIGSLVLASLAVSVTACSFAARSPEMYRDDTAALLDTRTPEIKACYDQHLQSDTAAAGTVRLTFTVQPDTGKIDEVAVDPAGTSAAQPLADCVVQSITGLELTPPDQNPGKATFTWEFTAEGSAPAPAPETG